MGQLGFLGQGCYRIHIYLTQIRARTQSIISVSKSIFPESGSLNPLTLHMHNSQNTIPKFMKFLQQLNQSILNNFLVEHFFKIVLFQHEINRIR